MSVVSEGHFQYGLTRLNEFPSVTHDFVDERNSQVFKLKPNSFQDRLDSI
jgi:hypothetical protein